MWYGGLLPLSATLADLPEEVQAVLRPHMEQSQKTLDQIGVEIAKKRDEAKAHRAASGIEQTWSEAEDAYVGIDDANRHEFGDSRMSKPTSIDGPVTIGSSNRVPELRSTLFYRLTARYTDAGAAKIQEILIPADDKAFSFKAMPVPVVIKATEDDSQVVDPELGPLTRPLKPGETPPAGVTPDPQGHVPLTVKDVAQENIQMAEKDAKAAETRVYNWMIESQFRREFRKIIRDAAKVGTGILKGPFPKSKRVTVLKRNADVTEVGIMDKIVPSCERKSVWNIYPDPSCGDNIHNGDYIFEKDSFSARQVRGLKKLPGYIATQIDKILAEGPDKAYIDGDQARRQQDQSKDKYTVWYFYGALTKEEVSAIDDVTPVKGFDSGQEAKEVYAIVTLINDSVVRATINPLDSGSFPYHSMAWQERDGDWAGIGVPEQMRAPQRIVNAALRAMLNNAGKAADNQYVINQMAVRPADGSWVITPGKVWLTTNDFSGDIRQAFMAIQIANTTDMMEKIIMTGERFAEESTSIPLVSQGQSGTTTPDTFGGQQLQNNNANQLLRSIGSSFDDNITEPVVQQYYEWLLMDPDVPTNEKFEWEIDAHGSNALVERAIQNQTIAQMGGVAGNPIYGVNPKKWFAQWAKSEKLDPKDFQYTEDEQAKIDAAAQPAAPQIEVAKINSDTQLKLGVMKQTSDQQTIQHEQQVAAAANELEGKTLQVNSTVELHKEQMAHERALMEYANRMQISLSQVKAELAQTAMKLQVEERLNAANQVVDLHKHTVDKQVDLHKHRNPQPKPAVQVPGRARNGQAASQAGAGR